METIETLEKRKRELELRRDIASLERQSWFFGRLETFFKWFRRSPPTSLRVQRQVPMNLVADVERRTESARSAADLTRDPAYVRALGQVSKYGPSAVEAFETKVQELGGLVPPEHVASFMVEKFESAPPRSAKG